MASTGPARARPVDNELDSEALLIGTGHARPMSMSSAFDPSAGRAIPEDQVADDGLELDEDPARGMDIEVAVVSGAAADPAAPALFLAPQASPSPSSTD